MSAIDDFRQFVADEQATDYYITKWRPQNKTLGPLWEQFRDAILAGGRPAVPDMGGNHYGHALVDVGVETLHATAPAPTPTPTPTPTPVPVSGRWFADTAWVNTPLDPARPLDPQDATYQAQLRSLIAGIWVNGVPGTVPKGAWSSCVYHATGAEPPLTITIAIPGVQPFTFPHFDPAWVPSPDTDGHIVIVHPDGTIYETQGMSLASKIAHSVGKLTLGGPAQYPYAAQDGQFTIVAPFPVSAGLILAADIAAGKIEHALRCAVPWQNSIHRFPAQQGSGTSASSNIPVGAVLTLRNPDLSSLTNAYQRLIVDAIMKYGLAIGDAGGSNMIGIYVESAADGSTYPFQTLSLPKALTDQLVILAG